MMQKSTAMRQSAQTTQSVKLLRPIPTAVKKSNVKFQITNDSHYDSEIVIETTSKSKSNERINTTPYTITMETSPDRIEDQQI